MLKRKIMQRFDRWLSQPKRKALLVSGARQVGKTFAIRQFAGDHYDNVIEVNFLENKAARQLLACAVDVDDFVERLTLLSDAPLDAGRALVFLDEIQEADDAVTMAKFLIEADRFDLIMSGSLLGVELENVRSFPVGYLHEERMYPLDFEEFCWARGVPRRFLDQIRECFRWRKPLEDSIHQRFVQLFRQYIVVGGMPEVVQTYLDSGRDLAAVREAHGDLDSLYRRDISKYAKERSLFIRAIYDAMPSELAKVNKRFMMKSVKQGSTYESLRDDFEWLGAAGVALPTCFVSEPKFPLERTREKRKFKLYASDTGMLVSRYPTQVAMGVLEGAKDVNFGAVYENVVAQELAAAGYLLCYYNSNRKGEMDFLVETNTGDVVPVEVKSGKDYKRHAALNNMLETDGYGIGYAYVLSEANVSCGQRLGKPVYYLPLYMTMCFEMDAPNKLPRLVLDDVSWEGL